MPAAIKTEKSWLLALFGLPFFCIAAGLLVFSIIPTLHDAWRMASWSETPGKLLQARLIANHSGDSATYRVEAEYLYNVAARSYRNNRVTLNAGGDNLGDFQQTLGQRLEQALQTQQPVTVWYDPENPQDAVLNRELRWGLIGFKLIFVVIFGGIGLPCLFFGLRGVKSGPTSETGAQPWLHRPEWQGGVIRSGAKSGMYAAWGIAVFWNLVSMPAAFMFTDIWREKGGIAFLILLFPLAGLGLLYWAVTATLEWRRFGAAPVTLDPFPGALGGDVGGVITVNTPYRPDAAFAVTLSCINSYMSGSGDDRERKEKLIWQDSGYAEVQPAMRGARLQFRFAVPDGLPASETYGNNYHFWRLSVHGGLPGVDFKRSYDIPVYRTGEQSRRIVSLSTEARPKGRPELSAETLLPLTKSGNQVDIHYPILRQPLTGLGILLFGAIFCGSGAFLWHQAAKDGFMLYIMSGVFSFIGALILLWGLYALCNSLHVRFDGRSITAVRGILGIPVSNKSVQYGLIRAIEIKQNGSTQTGNTHRINYQVIAKTPAGGIILAEHLDAHSKAERVAEYFKELAGAGG